MMKIYTIILCFTAFCCDIKAQATSDPSPTSIINIDQFEYVDNSDSLIDLNQNAFKFSENGKTKAIKVQLLRKRYKFKYPFYYSDSFKERENFFFHFCLQSIDSEANLSFNFFTSAGINRAHDFALFSFDEGNNYLGFMLLTRIYIIKIENSNDLLSAFLSYLQQFFLRNSPTYHFDPSKALGITNPVIIVPLSELLTNSDMVGYNPHYPQISIDSLSFDNDGNLTLLLVNLRWQKAFKIRGKRNHWELIEKIPVDRPHTPPETIEVPY